MPFAVDPDRPLARSLARVGRGLVAAARDSLTHLADDPVLAVHDARRDIRVSRAVLRLMRPVIGEAAYREQHEPLRRSARLLSAHRDAHVLAGAFERLLVVAGDPDPEGSVLVRRAIADRPGAGDESLPMAGASVLLELERHDTAIEAWPRTADDLDAKIADGLAKTLRRVRRRTRRAERDPSVENLHELRKRGKDARDQLRVLTPRLPRAFGKLQRRLDRVTDLLGEGCDQWLLAEALGGVGADRPELAGPAGLLREAALARHAARGRRAVAAAAAIDIAPRRTARRLLPS